MTISVPLNILNIPESSDLWQLLSPLDGDAYELTLEGRCSQHFADELPKALKDLVCNGSNSIRITSLFVHKSFLKSLSEDQQIRIFASLPDLEELYMSSLVMSVNAIVTVLSQAKRLQKIRLDHIVLYYTPQETPALSNYLCRVVSELSLLKDFHMSMGVAATRTMVARSIPFFDENNANLDALAHALASVKSLGSVYLGQDGQMNRSSLHPNAFAALTQTIRAVTIRNMPLSQSHFRDLSSHCIQSLNLIQTELGDKGAIDLAQRIIQGKLSSLKKLYVAGNSIADEGCVAIANAIRGNQALLSNLELLDLHDNFLTSLSGSAVSELLGSHGCGLVFLDMSCNSRFDDKGGVTVASALSKNRSLEQLILYNCGVGDDTCEALAASLRLNRSLTKLNLYDNGGISEKGVRALTSSVEFQACHLQGLEIRTSHLLASSVAEKRREMDPGKKLQFFLRLNREYKREKVIMMPEQVYLDRAVAKASANNDMSAAFYFLSARPTLFSSTATSLGEQFAKSSKISCPASAPLAKQFVAQTFCNPQA